MIERQAYDAYSKAVAFQAAEARRKLEAFMAALDFGGGYEQKRTARNQIIRLMQGLVPAYGDAAATIAADFYNDIAKASGVRAADAVLAGVADDASIAGSVRYNAKRLFGLDASIDAFKMACLAAMERYIKKAANDTISKNAVRDGYKHGARFARIPTGSETCPFCIMLASRGFVYASKEAAGEFDHFHDHCDCKVVVGFGDDFGVEGHDVEKYERLYDEAVKYDEYGHVDMSATLRAIRERAAE